MTNYAKALLVATVVAAVAVGGFFTVFSTNAASNLEDAASLSQNNTFNGVQNKFHKGIYIGQQGSGGVTYFNGTIANLTTDADGNGIPVTVGDDMRVDGRIWRGEDAGTSDDMPVIINDNLEVAGSITGNGVIAQAAEKPEQVPGLASTTQVSPDYDAPEAVYVTTGDSQLLISYGTTLANNTADRSARLFVLVDGTLVANSIRRGTSCAADATFALSGQVLVDVDPGDHTVQLGFNTDAGTTTYMFNRSLTVLEIQE